jgi:hypothetical protein
VTDRNNISLSAGKIRFSGKPALGENNSNFLLTSTAHGVGLRVAIATTRRYRDETTNNKYAAMRLLATF